MGQPRQVFSGTFSSTSAGLPARHECEPSMLPMGMENKYLYVGLMMSGFTVNSGGATQFKLVLEHSVDGRNWPESELEELISYTNGTSTNYSGLYKVVVSTANFGPFVRLAMYVKDSAATNRQSLTATIHVGGKPV